MIDDRREASRHALFLTASGLLCRADYLKKKRLCVGARVTLQSCVYVVQHVQYSEW